ncbi:integrin alpha-PS1-like [Tubulanus polymorphus]|uniref:integrin alpha-PS1-like n=1 Tax=Tubulanus polymorphus TaxID=672921 RepID=UPI003DA4087D
MAATARWWILYLSCWCLFTFYRCILTFNLDTHIPLIKTGHPDSYFGFSVAEHIIALGAPTPNQSVILIGAPRGNSTFMRRVVRPGVVYSCPISHARHTDCQLLRIDDLGRVEKPADDESKDNQWMGVTLRSQGPGKKVLTCGHRYQKVGVKAQYQWGYGICYVLYNSLDVDKPFPPCEGRPKTYKGYFLYGYCQAGVSGVLSEQNNIILGLPGINVWAGGISKNTIAEGLEGDTWWYTSKVDPPPVAKNSYLGFSVGTGRLLPGIDDVYASGAPHASLNLGEVILFTQNTTEKMLQKVEVLTGDQFGASFGYEVVVIDINNDGHDDLVVGAPFYMAPLVGGKILVYMNNGSGIRSSTKPVSILSREMEATECKKLNCQQARFGFSLANLGDLNKDGYNDLAVGAPYEGNGAVYIFNGKKTGLDTKPSQRITAEDMKIPNWIRSTTTLNAMKTFGYSLSGGMDLDLNGYPDLLVGAYESNSAALLRARPAINLRTNFSSIPAAIRPVYTGPYCQEQSRICFDLEICFKYIDKELLVAPRITYTVIAERFEESIKYSRVSFTAVPRGRSDRYRFTGQMTLHQAFQDRFKCVRLHAFLDMGTGDDDKPSNQDLLNPIFFKIKYNIVEKTPDPLKEGEPLPDINSFPTFNKEVSEQFLKVEFIKNCGDDQICHSDLKVDAKVNLPQQGRGGTYLLSYGEVKVLKVDVKLTNTGEDAHLSQFTMKFPPTLVTKKLDIPCEKSAGFLRCEIGNPFAANQTKEFSISFHTKRLSSSDRDISIELGVNTSSSEKSPTDDYKIIPIRVIQKADIWLRGGSTPEQVFYGHPAVGESAIKFEDEIGYPLTQSYEVLNQGPGTIAYSTVEIYWPYEVENKRDQGKHLLYLIEKPQVEGKGGQCIMGPGQVNPLGIVINERHRLTLRSPVDAEPGSSDNNEVTYNTPPSNRNKRDYVIRSEEVVGTGGKKQNIVSLDCEKRASGYRTAKCFRFKCQIAELGPRETATIRIRARLWNHTLVEDYPYVHYVNIRSKAIVRIDKRLNIEQDDTTNDYTSALTVAYPDIPPKEAEDIPLWIIIVAICAGLLLLIIIILVCWKLGFFKRKRAEDLGMHEVTVKKKKKKKQSLMNKEKEYIDDNDVDYN